MRTTFEDFGHALRSLRRSGGTTLISIALFAITIGVTTAIYAVVDAVMLRPSAMRVPDRTVVVWQRDDARGTPVVEISYDEAAVWQRSAGSLDAVGVFGSVNWPLSLIQGESRSRVAFVAVSASFFDAAGVTPARGRALTARDELATEPRVAVISDGLWRQRFAADARVVGTLIRVQAGIASPVQTLEVVGIMPPEFDFPRGAQLWLPAAPSIHAVARQAGQAGDAFLAGLRVFYGLGRLRDGVSTSQAAQEIGAIARRQSLADAAGAVTGVVVTPVDAYLQGTARPVLWIMLGGRAADGAARVQQRGASMWDSARKG